MLFLAKNKSIKSESSITSTVSELGANDINSDDVIFVCFFHSTFVVVTVSSSQSFLTNISQFSSLAI